MHIYQKQILDLLRATPTIRYSHLLPDGVESSHFMYHLSQLMKDGLVEQVSRGTYALSARGRVAVDQLSSGVVNPRQTPKVITYSLLHDDTQYYLLRKNKQPYLGLLNMVGGKLHTGETSLDAAIREVSEKTGINAIAPALRAVVNIRIKEDDALLSHVIAYIYDTEITSISLADKPTPLIAVPKGELAQRSDLAPDLLVLIEAIDKSDTVVVRDVDVSYSTKV